MDSSQRQSQEDLRQIRVSESAVMTGSYALMIESV
jgi:hypothetical protein